METDVLVVALSGRGAVGCLTGRGSLCGPPNILRYLSMLGNLYSPRGGGGLGGSRCCTGGCIVELLRPVFIAYSCLVVDVSLMCGSLAMGRRSGF